MEDGAHDNDARLIDATLAGQTAAFGRLVVRYQDRLYNTLVHAGSSPDDARDVCQDAFVQALVKLSTFRGASGFYTWLYRIALNISISRRRRQRPSVSIEHNRETTGHEPIAPDSAPTARLEQQERVARVRAALGTLEDDFRTVLVLREIDGQPYETIAETLDLPIGTVRSRLHRARIQLRDQLKEVLHEQI